MALLQGLESVKNSSLFYSHIGGSKFKKKMYLEERRKGDLILNRSGTLPEIWTGFPSFPPRGDNAVMQRDLKTEKSYWIFCITGNPLQSFYFENDQNVHKKRSYISFFNKVFLSFSVKNGHMLNIEQKNLKC